MRKLVLAIDMDGHEVCRILRQGPNSGIQSKSPVPPVPGG